MQGGIALWALLTVLCAVAGPFGTHEAFGLSGRSAYWGLVVAVSLCGVGVVRRLLPQPVWAQVALWGAYALVITGLVFALNAVLFPARATAGNLAYLAGVIGVSVLVINGVIELVTRPLAAVPAADVDPQARFLRRLPHGLRAPLIRIEAQDHYLEVTTVKGRAMILLRMAEAVEELDGAGGVQVHRSHWVHGGAVTGHQRSGGRDLLMTSDGASVPVARTRRDAARAAGLI